MGVPTAETTDYGVNFEFFENRLSLGINWYDMTATGAVAPVGALNFAGGFVRTLLRESRRDYAFFGGTDAGFQAYLAANSQFPGAGARFKSWDDVFNAILNLTMAKSNGNVWTTDPRDSTVVWVNPPLNPVATQDYEAKGMEIELVGNVTKNWRLSVNVAKQTTVTANTAALEAPKGALLLKELEDSGLGALRISAAAITTNDIRQTYLNGAYNGLLTALAKDGSISAEQRKWRANFVSSYRFDTGRLNGFVVGGAVRWQDKAAIGYPQTVVKGVSTLDLAHPYYDGAQFNGDAWVGYTKKLKHGITWKIQLNVRNVVGDKDYIPVVINPDGGVAVVRNSNPQEVSVTNTFSF